MTKRASRSKTEVAASSHEPALALIEFDSIATGLQAGDAMIKRAPIARIVAGTVQPGHYLVLISGAVADVEESLKAGREVGGSNVIDTVYLPQVHSSVVDAIGGGRDTQPGTALGVIETSTVPAAIQSADSRPNASQNKKKSPATGGITRRTLGACDRRGRDAGAVGACSQFAFDRIRHRSYAWLPAH